MYFFFWPSLLELVERLSSRTRLSALYPYDSVNRYASPDPLACVKNDLVTIRTAVRLTSIALLFFTRGPTVCDRSNPGGDLPLAAIADEGDRILGFWTFAPRYS